jgi:aspartyl-tRNA(Asn)/glutamyl-tRNA(Gln) amidotransferase subunit B
MRARIGLEVHVRLETKSKLFCSCPTDYEEKRPNQNVCPICLGFPGSKPKLNRKAIDCGIMVSLALKCKPNKEIFFSRKSYFYPDMPKNFQISQYEVPLAQDGYLELQGKRIGIKRVHLEEDPGKLIHVGKDITAAKHVLVDYNRSGIPLLEIVTHPDFEAPKEARGFLEKLSSILEHLGVYDPGKEASMRVDANISLEGGERVEVKNITGFRNVERALSYEIVRQEHLRRLGLRVERETRHFDARTTTTVTLRKKEFEEDYGYIFDPDLPSIEISREWISDVRRGMPELPDARVERLTSYYGIKRRDSKVIVYVDKALADFFEECCKLYPDPRAIARWIVTDLLKCLNWNDLSLRESKVRPRTFIELLRLIDEGKVSERLAKEIMKEYVPTGKSPKRIVRERGLTLLGDKELETIVRQVLKANEKAVGDYRAGRERALDFLVGQVLRRTRARADPKVIRKLIRRLI